jgi:hypothetical protein
MLVSFSFLLKWVLGEEGVDAVFRDEASVDMARMQTAGKSVCSMEY